MAGRNLGDVFLVVSPDTRAFGSMTQVQVDKALAGIKPDVRVGVDTKDFNASLSNMTARIKALSDMLVTLRAKADTKAAESAIAATQAKLIALTKTISKITVGADTAKIDAAIATEMAKVKSLKQQMSALQIDADSKAVAAKIAALEKQAYHLGDSLGDMTLGVDIAAAQAKIAAIEAELKVLRSNEVAVKFNADATALDKQMAAAMTRIELLKQQAASIRLSVDSGGLLAAESGLLGIESAVEKLRTDVPKTSSLMSLLATDTAAATTKAVFSWRLLTSHVQLFGGILATVLPKALSQVAAWHILIDLAVEALAVLIPAAVAFGAFGLAGVKAANDIYLRMLAVNTVMNATGMQMPGLSGRFQQLAEAVRPEVYQLFGEALVDAQHSTGGFAYVAKATGTSLDQLGARFVYATTQGKGVSVFMKNAATDAAGFGTLLGNLGGIFGNVFKAVPGYAEILLSFADSFTAVLETVTRIGEPVIHFALVLHGAVIYLGLAVTATLGFVGALGKLVVSFVTFAEVSAVSGVAKLKLFGSTLTSIGLSIASYVESIITAETVSEGFSAALAPLAANPMIWIVAVAAALGTLAVVILRAKDAAQDFNASMQKTIQASEITSVMQTISDAQSQTAAKVASSAKQVTDALKDQQPAVTGVASRYIQSYNPALDKASTLNRQYQQGLTSLTSQAQLVSGRVGDLTKEFGSQTAAMGILNLAGITSAQITDTNTQHWAEATIQIEATVAAYKMMGQQAGQLGNDLDVVGRTATQQYKAIQSLNQAWGQFITDVTGSQDAFDTAEQGFETLATHSGELKLSLGKLKTAYADSTTALSNQAKVASASATAATAQAALNKLQSSGTSTALQLSAAHQRLAADEAKVTVAQKNLNAAQSEGKSAIDALTPAGIALNQAFGQQVGNIEKLAESWRTAGLSNDQFEQGIKDSIGPMVVYAQGSQEATAQLVALAEEAGYNGPVSMQRLVKWLGNTHDSTNQLKNITDQATIQESLLTTAMQNQGNYISQTLINDISQAILKYDGVQQAATAYGNAIARSGAQSDDAKAARTTLINDIIAAGKAAHDSAGEIAAMITKVTGIPAKVAMAIVMTGSGSYTIKGGKVVNGGTGDVGGGGGHTSQSAATGGYLNLAGRLMRAAGGYIHLGSGPTADDVPVMASKGEYVVKAASVAKYGKPVMDKINAGTYALGGPVPAWSRGFAGGGLIDQGNKDVLSGQYAVTQYSNFQSQMTAAMVTAMKSSLKQSEAASVAAAAAAAASSGGGAGSPTPGGGNAGANAALARKLYPAWGSGAQWTDWNNVAMRESGWNQYARNASSGAYGIPQALPASKMGAAANPPQSNPGAQINWMIGYIKQRYGNPAGAWAHELSAGWYDNGGKLPTGMTMALNGTGRAEQVLGPDSVQNLLAEVSSLMSAIQGLTGVLGGATGSSGLTGALSGLTGSPGLTGSLPVTSVPSGWTGLSGTTVDANAFGLTRSDLGLPASTSTDSGSSTDSGTGTDDGSGSSSGTGTGTTTTSKPVKPAGPNATRKAAIKDVRKYLNGYIWHNQLAQMKQANTTLAYLGDSSFGARLGQIEFFDAQMLAARKKKDKKAEAAAEKLLAHYGVHVWQVQESVKGDQPRAVAKKATESLMRGYIAKNDMVSAGQANTLLTHWSETKYTAEISAIRHLDTLLAQYRKAKDNPDVMATETLLKKYGVKKFARGGVISEPVTGFGAKTGMAYQFGEAGPETVVPGVTGDSGAIVAELRALRGQVDSLTSVTAAGPARTGQHVAAAVQAGGPSAAMSGRYPRRWGG